MKIGAHFLPEDFLEFIDCVQLAEESGYDRAWIVDSQMLWEDVWVYMTRALLATDRIQLGVGVANPLTRHYTVSASAAATLAQLHPGRVILGLGRGDSAVRTLGLKQVATKKFAEVVPRIRALLAGEEVATEHAPIRIRWASGEKVPIGIAATGPRNLRLAGALADIAMLQVGANPTAVRWAVEQVSSGAEQAGRDPDEVEIAIFCGMWVSDDLDESREESRWAAACAANHIGDVIQRVPDHGMPEELTRLVAARTLAYDYYEGHLDSSAEHTGWLTPELIDDFAITGSPDRCLARIEELAACGVDEISTAYLNGKRDQLRRVGESIIPALAAIPA
jgi:alkanesulfonate monooxygenase SsuD/methylene tetrahydromethanopterin reductase-like flavin-dependent oxidoreductase (luciferase family)